LGFQKSSVGATDQLLINHNHMLQWFSGSMLACSVRGVMIEPRLRTSFCVFHKIAAIYAHLGMAAHLLQCLWSTQRSILQELVKSINLMVE